MDADAINAVAKQVVDTPEFQSMIRENAAYKEFYEALDHWTQCQAAAASNDDYLPAADRLRAARMAVKKLRNET